MSLFRTELTPNQPVVCRLWSVVLASAVLPLFALALSACGPEGGAVQTPIVSPTTTRASQSMPTSVATSIAKPVATSNAPQPVPSGVAASPSVPTGGAGTLAPIESVQVLTLESFPVQAQVQIKGYLPTPCHKLGGPRITQEPAQKLFKVELPMLPPGPDEVCIEMIEPFELTVKLDIKGLKAGTYTVSVNGVTGHFTLATDNVGP